MSAKKAAPSVKVRCIACKATRDVKAGDVKPGDHPMCEKCSMPMVPVEARTR